MTSVVQRKKEVDGGDQEIAVDVETERPRRRFEPIPDQALESEALSEQDAAAEHGTKLGSFGRAVLSRRWALTLGTTMLVAGVGGFAGAAQISSSKGSAEVSEADARRIFHLQSQIQATQSKELGLPDVVTSERGLVTALQAGTNVATLQNDYRILSREVGRDGRLEQGLLMGTVRDLSPYFATSTDDRSVQPWYLLASDASVPEGTGIPRDFRSGFTWVAQAPYGIDENGRVNVTWLALESDLPAGQSPQVLAWAQADYDVVRKVFLDVRTGTSAQGEQRRLEVSLP